MSLSTTTTATYELVKYSRAYSHTTPSTPSEQAELQWQHFANPVIRLTMDTRRSTAGHLESYRLRIVWTFSAGPHAMDVDEREVVFEDLDLVTYSAMSSLQPSMHGIPLKAVYQDAVVGLRYQHPRVASAGATPQYRRFQITFENAAAASTFIDSIRFVCPCKANAPPARSVARTPTVQTNSSTRPRATQPTAPSILASQSVLRASQSTATEMGVDDPTRVATMRRTQTSLPPFSSLLSSSSAGWDTHTASQGLYSAQRTADTTEVGPGGVTLGREEGTYSSSSRPSSAVSVSSAAAAHASSSSHRSSDGYVPAVTHTPAPVTPAPSRDTASKAKPPFDNIPRQPRASSDMSDLPSSSFPQASSGRPRQSSPDLMPPPPVPASAVTVAPDGFCGSEEVTTPCAPDAPFTKDNVVTTLSMQEGRCVYGLPKEELEALVAEVIREEGFAELVSSYDKGPSIDSYSGLIFMAALDGMWRVKGLVGIP
ncbi:hypothetical protein GY45DRAFT_1345613 [Cubamyces sp. BRFM 1775]|nr:hypothetical protein GY45DRAFT_1345613 [Cubamyces sp. BRFM 1775]